jgi:peroxiredoxin Q/BCP
MPTKTTNAASKHASKSTKKVSTKSMGKSARATQAAKSSRASTATAAKVASPKKSSTTRTASATRAAASKSAPKSTVHASKPASAKPAKIASAKPGLIVVGAPAPSFSRPDASGSTITLASLKGKPAVLFFYPQDDTPGCTVESCAFRDNRPKFAKLGCPVIGISPDSVDSHKAFDAKFKLGLTLLADQPGADGVPPMAAAYGVWQEKNMYGRKYMGIVRTTYVLAPDGTVAARFDKVKVDGHAEEVLAAVKALG